MTLLSSVTTSSSLGISCSTQWSAYLALRSVLQFSQAQSKILTQKSHFINLDQPNQFQACSCHTLKVPRWTGQWTMGFTIGFQSGAWKCENILECELAALPEWQWCKKVIAWSRDFGMDQYVSWCFPAEELNVDTIWGKFEELCKPQLNEVRAHFDLLTSFSQCNRSVDEWYNAVQAQVNLAKYPPETAKILHRDIFWFFLHDEEFVSKTINDGNVDLDKFPASKVRQLAKRMESSKATAYHIKQVTGDPQAAQINLLRQQCTQLPAGKYKKKKSSVRLRQSYHKNHGNENSQVSSQHKKQFDVKNAHQNKEQCSKCGDSTYVEHFQCPAKMSQCMACYKFGTLPAFVIRKNKLLSSQGN